MNNQKLFTVAIIFVFSLSFSLFANSSTCAISALPPLALAPPVGLDSNFKFWFPLEVSLDVIWKLYSEAPPDFLNWTDESKDWVFPSAEALKLIMVLTSLYLYSSTSSNVNASILTD